MAGDMRLTQLARMLNVPLVSLSAQSAPAIVAAKSQAMSTALFEEAAASDDVTSVESALDYLEGRLAFFDDLIPAGAAAAIRTSFAARLKAWE
jgi:hypothetical protein